MDKSIRDVKKFILFAAKELNIVQLPPIHFVGNEENSKNAFGHFAAKRGEANIYVRTTQRHPIDIMRTIAHELVHYSQKLKGLSASEDQANAHAGRIMRKYDTTYPSTFKDKAILSAVKEELSAGVTSVVPANVTGSHIANYDPLINMKPGGLMPKNRPKGLRNILKREKKLERRADTRNDQ
jgi:hypothetical protein